MIAPSDSTRTATPTATATATPTATATAPAAPTALEPTARWARVCLALTLLLAAALRFAGLRWGLPDIDVRPDEELIVTMALKFGSGDLNPHWFWYPTLEGYVLFAFDLVLVLVWKLTGVISSPGEVLTRYAEDPSAFYLIARALSAACGTATVWAVYALGRRVHGAAVGLASAFVMAVAFLPVRDSHFATIDPPMTALATLAMLPAWSIFERPTRRAYLLAGALVGLAASTKYYGVVAFTAVIAAHLLRPRRPGEPARHGDLVLSGLACVGAFLAASPYIVLAFPEFLRDLGHVRHVQSGKADDHLARAWWVHLFYTFPRGLTWPIFAAVVGGLVGSFATDLRRSLVLYAYPLAFLGVVGASWMGWARYVTPAVPFLAVAAGWFVCRASAAAARAFRGDARAAGRVAAAATVLIGVPALVEDGFLLHHFYAPDTRREAADWFRAHVSDGAAVGWLGSIYGRPPLPQSVASLERRLAVTLEMGRAGLLSKKRLELARSAPPPRYLLLDLPRDPAAWTGEPPEYLMREDYPLFYARKEVALADAWLRRGDYREVRRWAVTDRPGPLPYSDPQDAVYLPFGELYRVRRGGPELTLYRRAGPGDGRDD